MASDNGTKNVAQTNLDVETQDEIDQIMSEIENLQQGLGDSEPVVAAAAPPPAPSKAKLKVVEPPTAMDASTGGEVSGMEEFHGSGGEPSMEETLAEMKEDPSVKTLLDSAVESEETAQETTVAEETGETVGEEVQEQTEEFEVEAQETPQEACAEVGDEVAQAIEEAVAEVEPIRPRSKNSRTSTQTASTPTAAGEGCLSMTLTGQMTLKLRYDYEGQEVCIGFEDQTLKVSLADGTEFKIPIGRNHCGSKAA